MKPTFPRQSKSGRSRQGSVYVAVLGVALIVSIISLTAMQITRLQLKSAVATEEIAAAQVMARSAVEYALALIEGNASWRSAYNHGQEYPGSWVSLNGVGEFKFMLLDSDGNLSDDQNDVVTVKGIGRSGDATYVASVKLEPQGAPLSCLEASFCTNGNIATPILVPITTNQFISSNGSINVSATGSSVQGSAQAVVNISGTVTGSRLTGIVPREMPHEHVFDYYLYNGTWIDVDSLPVDLASNPVIENTLLSPNSNPFGRKNPSGIYVIDCKGKSLLIRNCRIMGTIVLLNPGSSAGLYDSIHISPAAANLPAVLAQGDLCIRTSSIDLSELVLGVNFNPIGTAYLEVSDSDLIDIYPSIVDGLVYASGKITFDSGLGTSRLRGVTISQQAPVINKLVSFTYDPVFYSYPPPGFAAGPQWRVMPASWQRTSY